MFEKMFMLWLSLSIPWSLCAGRAEHSDKEPYPHCLSIGLGGGEPSLTVSKSFGELRVVQRKFSTSMMSLFV